jgi:hypothetical protein
MSLALIVEPLEPQPERPNRDEQEQPAQDAEAPHPITLKNARWKCFKANLTTMIISQSTTPIKTMHPTNDT